MTPEQLAADRATCNAATPGPWEAHSRFDKRWPATVTKTFAPGESCFQRGGTARICADFKICWGARDTAWLGKGELDGNLDFIAAARERWPAALDEIERLNARVTELETQAIKRAEEVYNELRLRLTDALSRRAEK